MAHALTFDTLAYAKKLIAVGVPEKQAEVQAEALFGLVEDQLATKYNLKEMEVNLTRDIKELELRLTLRFGIMIASAVAVLAAIIKL